MSQRIAHHAAQLNMSKSPITCHSESPFRSVSGVEKLCPLLQTPRTSLHMAAQATHPLTDTGAVISPRSHDAAFPSPPPPPSQHIHTAAPASALGISASDPPRPLPTSTSFRTLTPVLDSSVGKPAQGVKVELSQINGGQAQVLATG